jgi:uncharacterized MAPEG superfamily protein
MTIANWCILAAGLLPLLCAWMAKAGRFGLRENHDPRAWLARQEGWRARANAAQANSFEALPLFVAGVLVAQQQGAAQASVDHLALAFVGLRLVYIGLYVADLASLRSLVWVAGLACSIALFFIGR